LIKKKNVTIWDTVASFWETCTLSLKRETKKVACDLLDNNLRLILSSGGELPSHIIEEWKSTFNHKAQLVNMYGQTETIGNILVYMIPETNHDNLRVVPLGPPLTHTKVLLLDESLQQVTKSVPSELHIGGLSVARGYFNRPDLTAENFVPDPLSDIPGERLYKTGDLGRFIRDNTIEFLGRKDFQINIRGFRIEPGEIETKLKQHRSILEAVVVSRHDLPSENSIAAYFVSEKSDIPSTSDLRRFLSEKLPEYMIPSFFMKLECMPRLPNGKIDRQALPRPGKKRPSLASVYVMPGNQTEKIIADIWQEVLGIDEIGIHDNFFDLGGNSLLIARVIARMKEEFPSKDLPIGYFLGRPTVQLLSSYIIDGIEKNPVSSSSSLRGRKRRELIRKK
jgi:aspartate racemase